MDHESHFSFADTIPIGIFVVDRGFHIQFWNACFEDWTGIERESVLYKDIREIFPRFNELRYQSRLIRLFEDGMPIILSYQLNGDLFSSGSNMQNRPVHHCTITAIPEPGGYQALFAIEDMTEASKRIANARVEIEKRIEVETELRTTLAEKQVLMNELNHRVKNSLNMVRSLIGLQENAIESERCKVMHKDLEARIDSISLLHEMLYKKNVSEGIRIDEYLSTLCETIFTTFIPKNSRVQTRLDLEDLTVSNELTVHLGLIVTELLTNAIKYGIGKRKNGTIAVDLRAKDNQILLSIADDGPGLAANFNPQNTNSLGMKLVCMMTEQMGGTIQWPSEKGTHISITFPLS